MSSLSLDIFKEVTADHYITEILEKNLIFEGYTKADSNYRIAGFICEVLISAKFAVLMSSQILIL